LIGSTEGEAPMRYSYGVAQFVRELFWFDQPLAAIERERRALIEKRAEAKRLHRPVAELDAQLSQLTKAALRKRKRIWERAA
jgi:hypothetical protein